MDSDNREWEKKINFPRGPLTEPNVLDLKAVSEKLDVLDSDPNGVLALADERALLALLRETRDSLLETANLLEAVHLDVQTDADYELVNRMTFHWLREKMPNRLKRAAAVLAKARN